VFENQGDVFIVKTGEVLDDHQLRKPHWFWKYLLIFVWSEKDKHYVRLYERVLIFEVFGFANDEFGLVDPNLSLNLFVSIWRSSLNIPLKLSKS